MNDDFFNWTRMAFRRLHCLDSNSTVAFPDASWLPVALRHRVVGLLSAVAPLEGADDKWCRNLYGQALHSARLSVEAGRIFSALRDTVTDLRLVKGPVLALQAWPDPGIRSFDDLDMRCSRESLGALLAGMNDLGYRPEVDPVRLRNLWHYGWGIGFHHGDGHYVEFNHRMFPTHFPWPAYIEGDRKGWITAWMDGTKIVCPDPAYHLLICCLHAVWHGWERIGWVADIAGLLARHPVCFQDATARVRPNSFAGRALQLACVVATRWFGPFHGVGEFRVQHEREVNEVISCLMRQENGGSLAACRAWHHRLMSSSELLAYTLRRGLTPGDRDFQRWSFSGKARCLYYILRPLGGLTSFYPTIASKLRFLILLLFLGFGGVQHAEALEEWTGCVLVPWEHNDGDSFLIRTPEGTEHRIRL